MGYDESEWGDLVEPHTVEAESADASASRYEFTIPDRPVPKGRPRFNPRTKRTYTDSKTRGYESRVGMCAQRAGVKPLDGDVVMHVRLYFEKRNYGDVSNYAKAIEDGLEGIAYDNDKQIRRLVVERLEGAPRAEVAIAAVEAQ